MAQILHFFFSKWFKIAETKCHCLFSGNIHAHGSSERDSTLDKVPKKLKVSEWPAEFIVRTL